MHIRCPNCRNAIEVVDSKNSYDVECPSCGSHFSLVASSEETQTHHEPISTIAHFDLIERIGIGGFGSVYKALDNKLGRFVAVKIPRKEKLDEAESEAFLRDARSASRLNHPNIVSVYEVGIEKDSLYIASELIEGADLREWMTNAPFPPKEAAMILAQVADGVHHAHENGIIHRDLKPANIMIGRNRVPRVLDFGLAKFDSTEMTVTVDGTVLGTPAYMSPEQASGKSGSADARSDVYSLGIILYEMLIGKRPFHGEKRMLLIQIQEDDPPSIRRQNYAVSQDLETICYKCLEKSPTSRYQSARELAEDLRRFLNGEPIVARPIGIIQRSWRWAKRQPAKAALLACAILLLLSLAIGGPYVAWQQSVVADKNAELAEVYAELLREKEQAREDQIKGQIEIIMKTATLAVPDLVEAIRDSRDIALPMLVDISENTSELPQNRIRAIYSIREIDEPNREQLDFLLEAFEDTDDSHRRLIVDALVKSTLENETLRQELIQSITDRLTSTDEVLESRGEYLVLLTLLGDETSFVRFINDETNRAQQTEVIQLFGGLASNCAVLAREMPSFTNSIVLRTLCLALGNTNREQMEEAFAVGVSGTISTWFTTSNDPGTHSAAAWMLKQWEVDLPIIESKPFEPDTNWFINDQGMTMIRVQLEPFLLGRDLREMRYDQDPIAISLDYAYYIAACEVTIGQFESFIDDPNWPNELKPKDWNPDRKVGPSLDCPLQMIRVEDAYLFCNWLSAQEGLQPCYVKSEERIASSALEELSHVDPYLLWEFKQDADGYRLPLVAEHEFAMKAKSQTPFFFGTMEQRRLVGQYGWYSENSWSDDYLITHPVGAKMPNEWGLFDTFGNVWEFCNDAPYLKDEKYRNVMFHVKGGSYDDGVEYMQSCSYLPSVGMSLSKNRGIRVVCRGVKN